MYTFFIFILGLSVGSFLNSVIYRLETGESLLLKRSYCPNCRHQLSWYDLIPVLSFLFLKGRCRYCSQKISWQYPLVEISTGALFALIFSLQLISTLYLFIIASFLIVIFVYDLKHYIIPDKVVYPAVALALIFNFQIASILSAAGAALFFGAVVLLSHGKWMGEGDVKLAALTGLLLGFPNIIVALFLAFFIGAIIGIGLILGRKKRLKSEVPFAPFLVSGTFGAIFFGEKIINWYLSLCWSC